jgi:hypothetical protein
MMIDSELFSKGHPVRAEASLAHVLENHKEATLKKIKGISDLGQLTDAFIKRLIDESLVKPLKIHFDRWTQKQRTEEIDASLFPANFFVEEGCSYQKQVARISIPFSGDPILLKYAPTPCGFSFPQGEVIDKTIRFDVILWGSPDDRQRVTQEIQHNCELIRECAAKINEQVKAFNESLPAQVEATVASKLGELTDQRSIFDDLGIPEEREEPFLPSRPSATPSPKKAKARAGQIIQIIQHQYVQQLNQTNYNVGDVNNVVRASG